MTTEWQKEQLSLGEIELALEALHRCINEILALNGEKDPLDNDALFFAWHTKKYLEKSHLLKQTFVDRQHCYQE